MKDRIWMKLLTGGTFLAVLTLLFYRGKTVYPLIFIRTFTFQIIVEVLFVLWLWVMLRYPQYRPKIRALQIVVAIWIGVLILTALTGFNIEKSFWSTQDRTIGIVFILHAFIFSLIAQTVAGQIGWRRLMQYLTSVGAAMALLATLNRFFPSIFYSVAGSRPTGTLGNPAFLGGYLLFMLAIGAWLLLKPTNPEETTRPRTSWLTPGLLIGGGFLAVALVRIAALDDGLYIIGSGLFVLGFDSLCIRIEAISRRAYRIAIALIMALYVYILFIANTRGSLLALVAGAVLLLVYYAWRQCNTAAGRRVAYKNPAVIALAALVVFGGVFVGTRSSDLWQKIPGLNRLAQLNFADTTVNNRKIVWGIAVEAFREKPLVGWGTDNFRYAFDSHYVPTLYGRTGDETYWDKPHNVFLESLATTGLIGFAAYLAIYVAFVLTLRRRKSSFTPFGYALIVAYALQGAVLFDSFATYLLFFLCIAFVSDRAGEDPMEKVSEPVRAAGTGMSALVAGGGAVLALWLIWTSLVIIYGNARQYAGLNYFLNSLPGEAIEAYREGFALSYPYASEIRQSYVASLKQMIPVITIPDVKGAVQLAIDEFPKAIAQDPNNHFLYYTLADARTTFYRIDKNFLSGAQQEIDRADELSPNRQQILFVRSRIKLALGDTQGGIAEMQKAIDLAPNVGEPHFYHAILSVGTATIDDINRELVLALDLGYQPKTLQEIRLVYQYFMLNEQYALGADYFSELNRNPLLRLEVALYKGALAFKATQFDVARSAFEIVVRDFPLFLATERYEREFKSSFEAVGLSGPINMD